MPVFSTAEVEGADYSHGDKCIEIANLAFGSLPTPFQLDDYQKWLLRQILQRVNGRYRFRSYVISLARQNGKSTLAVALSLWFMLSRGDANVFCLASNREQAGIVYNRLLQVIINNEWLNNRFVKTSETRGIATKTGGMFKSAPSKGAALQGHSLSGVIADELHIMSEDVWDSVLIGAGQQKDSIVVGITTAGSSDSSLLMRLYEQGKAGTPGMGFALWEAPEGSELDDIEALKKANPALAEGRMDPQQILDEVMMLPKADAIRYRLNRFIDQDNAWIDIDDFVTLPRLDLAVMPSGPVLCVDRTPEWSGATITANWVDGESVKTDIVMSLIDPTFEKLSEAVKTVASQVPHSKIVMDGYGLGDMAHNLKKTGFAVHTLTKKDTINATGLVRKAILDDKLIHSHNNILTSQMRRASVKEISDGEYRIVRTSDDVELDAVMATVLGCYQALVDAESAVQIF